jgi:sugar phosphate isomerase/epimerase
MSRIAIGLNGRFFPANWRPALQEIEFAGSHGFRCIQFPGRPNGLTEADLGAAFSVVAKALRIADLTVVMEIVVRINAAGVTAEGQTPLDILKANISAIVALRCTNVHWHLVPSVEMTDIENSALERSLVPQFIAAAALGAQQGFQFGFEHNEPELRLFGSPAGCTHLLNAVPDLHFVWDFNHTIPEHLDEFAALIPRMSAVHVSDTPLPEVNHHLPIGMGSINFDWYGYLLRESRFRGPAVLEIGGLPKSGGYGRDTDEALIESLYRLSAAFADI